MNFKHYYPESRFLKPNQDGGDALHRFGMCGIHDAITLGAGWESARMAFAYKLDQFYFDKHYHRFYRATFTDWWMKVGVSADQLRPVIVALGLFNLQNKLDEIEHYLKIHNWWATNTYVNGPERIKKLLPDHAFTLRGVIDRARGQKTKWVEMNDRIALAEVFVKKTITETKSSLASWGFPLGVPKHDGDPTNRIALMVQSQHCLESARTSTAEKARKMYMQIEIALPDKFTENNQIHIKSYAKYSWRKYWFRSGDPQRENIAIEWLPLINRLQK